jgi:N-acetylglucosamine-6-phosphate deacetylase
MRLSLDDLRVLTVQEGTLAAEYGSTSACTDFVKPNACVLLADMLGDAVVWFALVPSDVLAGREFLTLPGLVDMQANGDEGVLRNGWVVKLATPVKRECGEATTSSLRDFITRFPDQLSKSIVNLTTDNVVSVKCK